MELRRSLPYERRLKKYVSMKLENVFWDLFNSLFWFMLTSLLDIRSLAQRFCNLFGPALCIYLNFTFQRIHTLATVRIWLWKKWKQGTETPSSFLICGSPPARNNNCARNSEDWRGLNCKRRNAHWAKGSNKHDHVVLHNHLFLRYNITKSVWTLLALIMCRSEGRWSGTPSY